MTPEEEKAYLTCKCSGTLHRFQGPNLLGPDFTDCRDYLHSVRCKCDKCGKSRKRDRKFVPDGYVPAEEFIVRQQEQGWPVPPGGIPA